MSPQICRNQTSVEHRHLVTRARLLKRVFGIDIRAGPACGEALRIIDCIGDPAVISKVPSSGP